MKEMKDFQNIMKLFGKSISDNSPLILTVLGATGVAATAVFAAKGAVDAFKTIEREKDRRLENLDSDLEITKREYFALTWKHFVPAVTVGLSSMACVVGAHSVHTRRRAALLSLYSVTDKAFREYQATVKEEIGEAKEAKVREKVAEKQIANTPTNEVIVMGKGDHLCYDSYTGRYFRSNVEDIKRAENTINAEVINNNYASQNMFYNLIGMETTAYGEDIGWRIGHMMDLNFTSHLTPDGEPCLSVNYRAEPLRDYYKET